MAETFCGSCGHPSYTHEPECKAWRDAKNLLPCRCDGYVPKTI